MLIRVPPTLLLPACVFLKYYQQEGFNPIKLYADTEHRRAWPGGMGFAKAGGNYAPTIQPQALALEEHGCAQVWVA